MDQDPADFEELLRKHGKQRQAAKERAADEMQAIADLAPKALAAGLSKTQICLIARISRPTLDELLRDQLR